MRKLGKKVVVGGALLLAVLALSACESIQYYSQAVTGHSQIMLNQTPIVKVISDTETETELARRLTIIQCFPVAGCVSYRGFFKKAAAEAFADQLKAKGNDVIISGASAYSTLGQVYQAGDTAFNESFATSVELMGIQAWAKTQGADSAAVISKYQETRKRNKAVVDLILKHRESLTKAYKNTDASDQVALAKVKKERFEALRADYKVLRQQGGGSKGYDRWFANTAGYRRSRICLSAQAKIGRVFMMKWRQCLNCLKRSVLSN